MEFKYVPVLRGLRSEMEAISNQSFSTNIAPLIEIIKDSSSVNSKDDFTIYCTKLFNSLATPFFVDIPMYLSFTKKTKPEVAGFLSSIYQNTTARCNYLKSLSTIKPGLLIPVISYNSNFPYINDSLTTQAKELRPLYNRIAFRVFYPLSSQIIVELKTLLHEKDIIIFDIGDYNHDSYKFKSSYELINKLKSSLSCITVILHHALKDNLTNSSLMNSHAITNAVTDLIDVYNKKYGFDAFGDFAGIKSGTIENIPISSPAYIHYCSKTNKYVGFKGVFNQLKTYTSMVLPAYTQSRYWTIYLTKEHKDLCYGCKLINDMLNHSISPNYAPKWKTLTIAHYIRSIDELL